jgi:hypothetical protein
MAQRPRHPDQRRPARRVTPFGDTAATHPHQRAIAHVTTLATAHPGGDRWLWESRIFAGTYDDAPAADRPKYG